MVLEILHNSDVVARRRLPNPSLSNIFNVLLIGLRFTLSFEWPYFRLKCLGTVMSKGQAPKFKTSIWNFPNSETGSKCNSVFRPDDSTSVIIMELKRKVESSWHILLNHLGFQGIRKLTFSLRHKSPLI